MVNSKIRNLVHNPLTIFESLGHRGFFNWMDDETYLKMIYRARMHKKLNLGNPQTFNEKLQWLKLHDRKLEYTKLVDKYEVRKYIADTIGKEYLIPLLGVWDRFEDVNFNKLPDQFVLKCTHDSGGLVICKDKSELDMDKAHKTIKGCLKHNYYWGQREWVYKNIKPRIIAEKYMVDESGTELKDYKFMCFGGEPKCLFVCLNRNSKDGLNVDFYDMEWRPIPFERKYKNSGNVLVKPKNFNSMIELSKILSTKLPFVRVDFYDIKGKVYFGELTFYPGTGMEEFRPDEWDKKLGDWIMLPL